MTETEVGEAGDCGLELEEVEVALFFGEPRAQADSDES